MSSGQVVCLFAFAGAIAALLLGFGPRARAGNVYLSVARAQPVERGRGAGAPVLPGVARYIDKAGSAPDIDYLLHVAAGDADDGAQVMNVARAEREFAQGEFKVGGVYYFAGWHFVPHHMR